MNAENGLKNESGNNAKAFGTGAGTADSISEEPRVIRFLRYLRRYMLFFLTISFAVTCCMLLFLGTTGESAGIVFTEENISKAAKLTFVNIIFISLIFTVIDGVRRWFTVTRPVRYITRGMEKIISGDFSVRIAPLKGIAGENGFNVITEQLNRMTEELGGTETLRSDFIANVSHELKTPLAVISNYGTLLKQPGLSEEQRMEYASSVTESSRRLAELTENILRLNKLENQQIYPKRELYDLGEQLCGCLLAFEDIWENKGLEIETDIEDEVMVREDKELLSLVWNNLFSNALKFTDKGGKVTLTLKREDGKAVVKVTDTGCGISRENGSRIFEKFYQGDSSRAVKGNGLGLALVKRVIDITKGDISVESEPGKGSTFTVTLCIPERTLYETV